MSEERGREGGWVGGREGGKEGGRVRGKEDCSSYIETDYEEWTINMYCVCIY